MNCATHTETEAVAFCRQCGKGLCADCRHTAMGTVFCSEHVPASGHPAQPPPASAPPPTSASSAASPGVAFVLGLIPGVGAIYNAQYAKGLIHVVVFAMLITMAGSSRLSGDFEVLFGLMIPAWIFYMAFEAYHTAKRRLSGELVDEFSGLVSLRGSPASFPVAPVLLIVAGVIFLLNNLNVLRLEHIIRYGFPIFLIALGVYLLYVRITRNGAPAARQEEAPQ